MDEYEEIFGKDDDTVDLTFEVSEPEYVTPIKSVDELQVLETSQAASEQRVPKQMTQFDSILDALGGRHAERFNHLLTTMGPAEFIKAYTAMLSYVRPKFKALEPKIERPKVTELVIAHKTITVEDRTLPKMDNVYVKQIKEG